MFSSVGSALPASQPLLCRPVHPGKHSQMAPGVEATFAITAPVLSSSLLYLHTSSSSNSSSKALLVPEPDSRPTTTMGASFPPASFQLVIFPS